MNMLLQSLTGTCRYCGQKAGFLRKQHPSAVTSTKPTSKR